MKIADQIYGEFEIEDPVILELLETPSIVRLKKVSQSAVPQEYYQVVSYSRFEHSVGVMLLLRKLGAGLEEQVTGLLHDVSHTAFSHLIDLVVNGEGGQEDYQDNRHESMVRNSELPAILQKHNIPVERVMSHKLDSLLEKELPELCADRVDYGLREIFYQSNPVVAKACAEDLTVADSKIVFQNKASSLAFATHFLARQRDHWGAPEPMLRWEIFAEMLRQAMAKKIIELKDFDGNDEQVMSKLKASNDPAVQSVLDKLRNRLHFTLGDEAGKFMRKKFRYVDPLYLEYGQLLRLSEQDKSFLKFVEDERESNQKGFYIIHY